MGIDAEMFVRTRAALTDKQVRKLSYELCAAFGSDKFMVSRPTNIDPGGSHALNLVDVYEQDGPDIVPEPGEQFVRVSMFQRYYGEGYERGDIAFICAVADWLERRIPNGTVWYGGDSSGVCAAPFRLDVRNRLLTHFANVGHHPYVSGRDGDSPGHACAFCGGAPMVTYAWGPGGRVAACCWGCGVHEETTDRGNTWREFKEPR